MALWKEEHDHQEVGKDEKRTMSYEESEYDQNTSSTHVRAS